MRSAKLLVCLLGVASLGACYVAPSRGYTTTSAEVWQTGQPGPYTTPTEVYVQTMPPDPIYEEVPSAPAYDYVWIDGYWNWSGSEWLWYRGRWERPRVGYAWVRPYYDYSGGRYVYTPGYWTSQQTVRPEWRVYDYRDNQRRPPTYYRPTQYGGAYPNYPQPGGGTVVVPSQRPYPAPAPNPSGTVVVPSQRPYPAPAPSPSGTVVVPSQRPYAAPQSAPSGTVVVPSQPQPQPRPAAPVVAPSAPPARPVEGGRTHDNRATPPPAAAKPAPAPAPAPAPSSAPKVHDNRDKDKDKK
ncbi:MAG TPA: hypothetical protein VKE22_20485 [Haliangiales bacterium]|nr:hypothetical protein [Haliangiales bacterium]